MSEQRVMVRPGEASKLSGVTVSNLGRWAAKGWVWSAMTGGGRRLYDRAEMAGLAVLGDGLTCADIARYFFVDPKTASRWAREGRLGARKLGGNWRFRREDVQARLRGGGGHAAA